MVSSVPDIRLVQNTFFPKYNVTMDWQLMSDGTLDDTQALASAVCVALGTNAEALDTDILPDPNSTDRQGWWGDLDAQLIWGGWPIGSKLWLLQRAKILDPNAQEGSTLARVIDYIRQALQPFVENRICSRFEVAAARVSDQQIDAQIIVYRGPLTAINLQYQILWSELVSFG
jgi:phage gp46-like protein